LSKQGEDQERGRPVLQILPGRALYAVVDIGVLNLFLWLQPTRETLLLVLYNGVALVLAT
jgi:hypothetical protein